MSEMNSVCRSALRRFALACAVVVCVASIGPANAVAGEPAKRRGDARAMYHERDDVRAFIAEMTSQHGFDERQVERWLAAARYQPKVVELMSRPILEPPKWYEYSPQFLAKARVDAGVAF